MSLQRQHFLLSYLKTLSVGPAGDRTHDLPVVSPVLNQLSQPVGGDDVIQSNQLQMIGELLMTNLDLHVDNHSTRQTINHSGVSAVC